MCCVYYPNAYSYYYDCDDCYYYYYYYSLPLLL